MPKKDSSIHVAFIGLEKKYEMASEVLLPEKQTFEIEQGMTFKMPSTVNMRKELPKDKYTFNISLER
ncbi:MAG: hypothetical protein ACOCZ6_01935 [Nanoarchaeota archaeon]